MTLRNPAQEDKRTYRSVEITKVEEFNGNFLCQGRNRLLFWVLKEYGVEPSVGDVATFYDESATRCCFTRGLFIGQGPFQNDSKCFYSASEQSEAQETLSHFAQIEPERARAKEKCFKWMKERLNKQYEELPEFPRNLIDEVREKEPSNWKKFGNLEVFLAREATKIILVRPVKGAMELWRKGKYSEIEEAIQEGLDTHWNEYNLELEPRFSIDEHSFTTFRLVVGSAAIYKQGIFQPESLNKILSEESLRGENEWPFI